MHTYNEPETCIVLDGT